MKKVYSIIMMLAMMVAALGVAACSSSSNDDDDEVGGDSSSSYIEVKYNGKTYREVIPEWVWAQIDPVGVDGQGKKLTYTYDMRPHFEDNGFTFMFGIVHFRNRSELLRSASGSYICAKDIYDDASCNNLTFIPLFEVDGDEYDFLSGTHQVKSVSSASGGVYVEGSFTASFKLKSDRQSLSGSYKMLIPN